MSEFGFIGGGGGGGGAGAQGIQGIQGIQGTQGVQGVQGLQGLQGGLGLGSQGYYVEAYVNGGVAVGAINTAQRVVFTGTTIINGFALATFVSPNDAILVQNTGIYKISARFHSYNGDPVNPQQIGVACSVNGTTIISSINNTSTIANAGVGSTEFEVIVPINAGELIIFFWQSTSVSLELADSIATANGYSVVVNVTNVTYIAQGLQGIIGTQGLQGVQGTQGISGAFAGQGIQGIQGIQGNLGIQGATGAGAQGIQGIQGTDGTQGLTGTQGIQGIQGTIGDQGAQGATGTQGATGVQGIQGIQGTQGTTGATGNTGSQGIQGIQGIQGTIGDQGAQGATGTQGTTGVQGIQGIQGTQGTQGATGTQGTTGIGTQGIQGIQGLQGLIGAQGAGGTTGYYGSFYSTQDQAALTTNTETLFTYNNTSLSSGVSVVSSTQITFANTGKYALNFSSQWFYNGGGGAGETVDVWLKKNGTSIPDSNTKYLVPSNLDYNVSSLDFLLDLTAGDYIEIAWATDNTSIIAEYDAAVAPHPATPSIIVNAFQVTYAVQGTQGIQGIGNVGAQGTQGIQGTDGTTGTQGVQGSTGATGNTGIQGIQGTTGTQGATGTQGTEGIQGIQGIGNTGSQGIQGIQGLQGVQGVQGLQGDPGVVGYFYSAYDVTGQTVAAINTQTIISFANTYGSNSVSISGGNLFRINESAVYKVQLEVQYRNTDATNTTTGKIYAIINSTAQVGTTVRTKVEPTGAQSATLEFAQSFTSGDTIQFAFEVDDTDLSLGTIAASGSAPTGASAFANIAQIARTLGPLDGNIQLSWTSGYLNLTNGVDNQLPFNNSVFSVGAALTSSNLSTTNAAVQFLYTGVYIVNMRAHLFDLGSNMTLSTTLYTSTNGTTWTLLTIIGLMRYTGTNTNQIQNSSFLVRVTSLPFYIQPRLNPSANAPFPADLGAPTAFNISRVGDL